MHDPSLEVKKSDAYSALRVRWRARKGTFWCRVPAIDGAYNFFKIGDLFADTAKKQVCIPGSLLTEKTVEQ